MADALRMLVLAMGAFLIGFALAVMREASKFRAPPRHVWAISISYIVLIAAEMARTVFRRGDPLGPGELLGLAAFAFGLYAMWLMWQAYQYVERMKRHDQQSIIEANRLMHEAFGPHPPRQQDAR